MVAKLSVTSANEVHTSALATAWASTLAPGLVASLSGELGAGKTFLVRALLRALGYTAKVKSPTYTLVEHYPFSRYDVYHFDLYRLGSAREWFDAGFDELATPRSICLIEWPEKGLGALPIVDLSLDLQSLSESSRQITFTAQTQAGERCLQRLIALDPPLVPPG